MISPTSYGDPAEGRLVIDKIRQLGTPVMEQLSETSIKGLMEAFAPYIFNGSYRYAKTRWVTKLQPGLIARIAESAMHIASPLSIITLFHLHGAIARVPVADTAFALRETHYTLIIATEWMPEDTADSNVQKKWANDLFASTAPYSLPGGYPAMLGNEDLEQIAHAHGSNLPRLQSVKKRYDPDNVFKAIPIALS